jgi:hypothetical protein
MKKNEWISVNYKLVRKWKELSVASFSVLTSIFLEEHRVAFEKKKHNFPLQM